MKKRNSMSKQTQTNWLIDAAVFLGGVVAILSGIYFLFVPSGGYQGGRNPMYGVTILFDRETWDIIHTWGGVAMIAAVAIHFTIHWKWVVAMSKRIYNAALSRSSRLSKGSKINVLVDVVVALSFFVCAVSGIYFLFTPVGGYQGGRNPGWDTVFLFNRTMWDVIHTWSGVVLAGAASIHFIIHWGWVEKVTKRVFTSMLPQPVSGNGKSVRVV